MASKFERHYLVSVQRNSSALADTGVEDVRIPAPSRLPMADYLATKVAVATANKLSVGSAAQAEFGGFTVYVSYCEAFGESELLATVERRYSWDQAADFTFASAHCGRIPYAEIDALNNIVAA